MRKAKRYKCQPNHIFSSEGGSVQMSRMSSIRFLEKWNQMHEKDCWKMSVKLVTISLSRQYYNKTVSLLDKKIKTFYRLHLILHFIIITMPKTKRHKVSLDRNLPHLHPN